MQAVGLQTPAWDADGLFIRFDEEGSVRKTISFDKVWRNEIHDLLADDSA